MVYGTFGIGHLTVSLSPYYISPFSAKQVRTWQSQNKDMLYTDGNIIPVSYYQGKLDCNCLLANLAIVLHLFVPKIEQNS